MMVEEGAGGSDAEKSDSELKREKRRQEIDLQLKRAQKRVRQVKARLRNLNALESRAERKRRVRKLIVLGATLDNYFARGNMGAVELVYAAKKMVRQWDKHLLEDMVISPEHLELLASENLNQEREGDNHGG